MEIGLNTQQLRTEPAQNKVQEKTTSPETERKAAEQIVAELKEGRVSGVPGTNKVETPENRTQKTAVRPARGRFEPERPEDRASFGSYKMVPDGENGTKIQFDAPTDGKDA